MSERGRQLVENAEARRRLLEEAAHLRAQVIVAVSFGDEDGLAELDTLRLTQLLGRLVRCKDELRRLRREYAELSVGQ